MVAAAAASAWMMMMGLGSGSGSGSLSLSLSLSPSSSSSSYIANNNNDKNKRNHNKPSSATLSSSSSSFSMLMPMPLIARAAQQQQQPSVKEEEEEEEERLHIMISGPPASGKGTQCQLISHKYGLVHVSAGDLLRTEISTASPNGKLAKQFMEKGELVPDDIVVSMVTRRLSQPDSLLHGWLLDGFPRSLSQATSLHRSGHFLPHLFILLDVSEDILVDRVVGRRLDPLTGNIYHLKYSPPESDEIAARLTQRFDDTEEKVKLRLNTHRQNVESVLSMYKDITVKINGNVSKEEVFNQIDSALTNLLEQRKVALGKTIF
ncbi:hypothetical protein RIF29_32824 [Crotalaria pallida]|uniref:adenylate kinase n=1 Tax=Crotalaria pallida TaxID=3830 RepID=A0AAN9HYB3_CROPI